ncbi:MAG: IPT/TIG domain-containing protein [Dehalococcoidia bacterium]
MRKRLITLGLLLVVTAFLAVPREHAYAANPPFISSITPATGSPSGGTVITVYGGNFQTGAYVAIGGVLSPTVSVTSSTQLTAVTPPGNLGPVQISVINTDGQSATASGFSYTTGSTTNPSQALWVAGINPGSGANGQVVHVTGTAFDQEAIVFFGSVQSSSVVWVTAGYLMASVPAGSGTVSVMVVNPNGQSATAPTSFTYTSSSNAPTVSSVTVTSIAPATVSGGTGLTILGTGFQAGATVTVGGYPATNVNVITSTLITATAPSGPAGTVNLLVSNPDGSAGSFPAVSYSGGGTTTTIPGQPTVTAVSPASGPAGTAVTITGSGFTSPATVTFGGAAATNVTVLSGNQISATVPAGTSSGAVTVLVSGATGAVGGLTNGFTYAATVAQPTSFPSLTSVTPTTGATTGGTTLTLNGSGFTTGATVSIGGAPASVVSVGSAQIVVTTPPGPTGAATVLVTNPGGAITGLANAFTYSTSTGSTTTSGPISISGVSPSSGPSAGGTSILINGAGFQTGATVTISGINVTGTVLSSSQIAASTPAVTGTGSVTVTVTNPDGTSASLPSAFTYGGTSSGGTTTPTPGAGGASSPVPSGGGLFVFGGGTNDQLVAAAGCQTANAAYWTTTSTGEWVGYVPSVPIPAVNAAWNKLFAGGIPAGTPIFARC